MRNRESGSWCMKKKARLFQGIMLGGFLSLELRRGLLVFKRRKQRISNKSNSGTSPTLLQHVSRNRDCLIVSVATRGLKFLGM